MKLKRAAKFSIFLVLVITALFITQIPQLRFNYIFEDFFPVNDPELEFYKDHVEKFGNDNDYLLIGLVHDQSVFDSTYLFKVNELNEELSQIDGVENTTSIMDLFKPVISPAGYFKVPFIHLDEPQRYKQDSARLFEQPGVVESIISKDARSTLIFLKHEAFNNKDAADKFVSDVISATDFYSFEDYYIAGKLYAQNVFISKIQKELLIFLTASVALVFIFLAIAYQNWWGVIIPLFVVSVSAIWILGLMAYVGKQLDLLMVLLPTIMFVVGMSDVVHLMTKYIENLRRGDKKQEAIKIALKEVGLATFLTSLTTSIGFLTLFTASIRPIQEFGLYTAIGVFIAFIVAFSLLPSIWVLLPRPKVAKKAYNRSRWVFYLNRIFLAISRRKVTVVIGSIVIIGVSLFGISQIKINTYLIEDLPNDDPLKASFLFFDQHLGGSRPFEVQVEMKKGNIFELEAIKELEKINTYLINELEIGGLTSPNTIVKSMMQAHNGGSVTYYRIPENEKELKEISRSLRRIIKRQEFEGQFYTKGLKHARISGMVDDIGSAISLENNKQFEEFVKQHIDNSLMDVTITGTSNLIDKNNEYLAINMLQGLCIAFGVVALIAGIMFKSARMVLITLIPNIIPLLMVAGIMGLFGITLKLSTSIVFTIAFGIAVDDTIHFTSKLKLELAKNKSLIYALRRTYLSTGKAIVVTSIILSGGFLILILSSFGGTFYTGLLISLTLIFALVIDLTLLPALVLLFYKR